MTDTDNDFRSDPDWITPVNKAEELEGTEPEHSPAICLILESLERRDRIGRVAIHENGDWRRNENGSIEEIAYSGPGNWPENCGNWRLSDRIEELETALVRCYDNLHEADKIVCIVQRALGSVGLRERVRSLPEYGGGKS